MFDVAWADFKQLGFKPIENESQHSIRMCATTLRMKVDKSIQATSSDVLDGHICIDGDEQNFQIINQCAYDINA